MMEIADLPSLNAALNATSACLLTIGWLFIKARKISAHKTCMLAAFATSTVFLISYLIYHYQVGSVPYTGSGWVRPVYFAILLTHVVLAATILPLAFVTLYRAARGEFAKHRRIARWTLPIWLYVSITGVVIYAMLYGI